MTYHCDRCQAALPGGAKTCPQCGRVFDPPVPGGTPPQRPGTPDPSVDALLRRSANRSVSSSEAPAWYGAAPKPKSGRKFPLWPVVTGSIVAVLALAGWGAESLWMRGMGGEIAYRQHNYAGNAAAERGDFSKADDEYSQMIALRPQRVDGYLLRAISEAKEGHTGTAIADNTQALSLTQEPMTRGDLFYNRAEAHASQGGLMKAVADFTQANAEYLQVQNPRMLRLVPDRREGVYSLRADAYWRHKDYALSIADSKAAIALGHVRPFDYGVQAKAEAALGLDKAAAADFNQALQMDPAYFEAYDGLSSLAKKHHDYAQAVAAYQRGVEANPTNANLWGNLGWFQYLAGQIGQAVVSDHHAQSLDPNQSWVDYNLALTYAAAGQTALARTTYAEALASGTAADQKAGLTDIQNALIKQPGSPALRLALAQVQQGRVGGPHPARFLRAPAPAQSAPKPPAPLAQFAALLAPEVSVSGYGIQPPKGYTLTQSRAETLTSSSTVYLWSGPRRADGTVPTLQAVIGQDDGTLAAHSTERQVASDALADMGSNHTALQVSPVSTLKLGALSFDGGGWDGVGQQTGKEYQGSEYWSVTPSHIIHISTHDAVPASRTTLPLLKASVLTFRKL